MMNLQTQTKTKKRNQDAIFFTPSFIFSLVALNTDSTPPPCRQSGNMGKKGKEKSKYYRAQRFVSEKEKLAAREKRKVARKYARAMKDEDALGESAISKVLSSGVAKRMRGKEEGGEGREGKRRKGNDASSMAVGKFGEKEEVEEELEAMMAAMRAEKRSKKGRRGRKPRRRNDDDGDDDDAPEAVSSRAPPGMDEKAMAEEEERRMRKMSGKEKRRAEREARAEAARKKEEEEAAAAKAEEERSNKKSRAERRIEVYHAIQASKDKSERGREMMDAPVNRNDPYLKARLQYAVKQRQMDAERERERTEAMEEAARKKKVAAKRNSRAKRYSRSTRRGQPFVADMMVGIMSKLDPEKDYHVAHNPVSASRSKTYLPSVSDSSSDSSSSSDDDDSSSSDDDSSSG